MPKKNASKKTSIKKRELKIPLLSIDEYSQIIDTDIFQLLGLEKISQKRKSELAEKIGDIILNRALIKIDAELNSEERMELKYLLDNQDEAKIKQFFNERHIDVKKIMIEEAIALKAQITTFVKAKLNQK